MSGFTPYAALAGGALIGAAATLLMLLNGRIAGVSGILGGLVRPAPGEWPWRAAFLLGLPLGAVAFATASTVSVQIDGSLPRLIVAGLLVGYGTSLGGGCTSGHGVCGLARFSTRSLAAVVTFMVTAAVTVFLVSSPTAVWN